MFKSYMRIVARAKRLGVSITKAKHPNRAARKGKHLARATALTLAKPSAPAKVVRRVVAQAPTPIKPRHNVKGPGRTYPTRVSHGACVPTLAV